VLQAQQALWEQRVLQAQQVLLALMEL
jgi:hypothetical protein